MSSSPNSSRYERVTGERGEGGEGQREVVRYVEVWREGGGKGGGGREGGGGGVRVEERVREEGELERVRGQLAMAQRENDELSQKYISVSERVSSAWLYTLPECYYIVAVFQVSEYSHYQCIS